MRGRVTASVEVRTSLFLLYLSFVLSMSSSFNVLGDEINEVNHPTSSSSQPPASLQRRLSYNVNIMNSEAARNVEAAAARDLEENFINNGAESPPPSRPAPRPIGSIKRKKNLGSTENVARTLAQVGRG